MPGNLGLRDELTTQRALVILMLDGRAHHLRRAQAQHAARSDAADDHCGTQRLQATTGMPWRVAQQMGRWLAGLESQRQLGTGTQVEIGVFGAVLVFHGARFLSGITPAAAEDSVAAPAGWRAGSCSAVLSASRARARRESTVPGAISSASAIWAVGMSSK